MPPDTNDILYAPLGTMTHKRGEDGFLYVTGTVSTDSLDLDNQRCDPVWLEKAIPDWFKRAGNVRVMHQPQTGGKAKEISQDGSSWSTVIKVTNPQAALDIEEGVLTGLSIGIKGARVDKSSKSLALASEGVINDGKVVEVSFVDLPANPDCKMAIAKMAGGHLEVTEDVEIVTDAEEIEIEKTVAVDEPTEVIEPAAEIEVEEIAPEPVIEAAETGDDMAYIGLGVSADLIKSASADDATDEVKSELRAEIVKALGLDGEIVTKAEFDAQQEAIKGLEAALKDVREMAAPGQPALRAQLDQQNKSAEADDLENTAAKMIARAYEVGGSDKKSAAQYVEAAEGLSKQAKALRESNL